MRERRGRERKGERGERDEGEFMYTLNLESFSPYKGINCRYN
jgi:hypothetical protein